MKDIKNENFVSSWYELSIKDEKTLLINIHTTAMTFLEEIIKSDTPIVESYVSKFSKFNSTSFILPSRKKSWGFGEILAPCESFDKDWVTYECLLPILLGKNGECIKTNVFALRATLSILFVVLKLFDVDTGCKRPQLMAIKGFRVDEDLSGGNISVMLTPKVSQWLSKQVDNSFLKEVEEVMLETYIYMLNKNKKHLFRSKFKVCCRQKWINFEVPGNACGLDPENYSDEFLDTGYCLYSHNTDSSIQQLTLVIGLAKFQDLIRKTL